MDFQLLADLFRKLLTITVLVDKISQITKKISSNISCENVIGNFFKHLLNNFEKEIQSLQKIASHSRTESHLLRETDLSLNKKYSVFRIKIMEIFSQKSDDRIIKKYQDLLSETYIRLKEIESHI